MMAEGRGQAQNICGDCSAPDPEWASLNRGILLCKECSFIHRSLGPQYSRVKFLKDAGWTQSLRSMVMTLAAGPANHVWEHLLLNPGKSSDAGVKKPCPTDSLETKRKFIHLKHFLHHFVLRKNADPFDVRNQELHSTVRTGALDTTLRLLASGANPNFFHQEKGTTPMHVAARNGQALQTELLFLHGADMDACDYLGQTPVEHAMAAGYKELAQRIMELRYYLTDNLSYFVCKEMPDHSTAKHILIPKFRVVNSKEEEGLKNLAANVLEQLAADLFDEVDRRRLEEYVCATASVSVKVTELFKFSIAFLPVNPNYSSVRNQTRQKFARLSADELSGLITMVLTECKRRHCNGAEDMELDKDIFLQDGPAHDKQSGNIPVADDDDYPLYDSVASDEDLVTTEQRAIPEAASTLRSSVAHTQPHSSFRLSEQKSISEQESKIQELQNENQNLKIEITILRNMVQNAIQDTVELKNGVLMKPDGTVNSLSGSSCNGFASGNRNSQGLFPNGRLKTPRPSSMCESGSVRYDNSMIPIRNCTTEVSLEKSRFEMGRVELIQTTTKKIVDLIKVLIEQANSSDYDGIVFTSNRIHQETHEMSTALLMKEENCNMALRQALEYVLFQVLRMKSEMPLLRDSTSIAPSVFIQMVKKLCFDVGAGMKQLVSAVMSIGD